MSETTVTTTVPALNQNAAGLAAIRDFFGMGGAEFRADYTKLSDTDKIQLRNGIGDGTLNY